MIFNIHKFCKYTVKREIAVIAKQNYISILNSKASIQWAFTDIPCHFLKFPQPTPYNATILNMLYMKLIELGCSEKDIERFLRISPMAWIHIAFTGRYTFNKKNNKIDLNEIIITLEKELKTIGIKNL